jgi:hypothetical protein
MKNRPSILQVGLRLLLATMLAAPLVVLFCLPRFVSPRENLGGVINAWLVGSVLYASGFWLTFLLLRRRKLRPRSVGLWSWSLVCGLVAASFVPLGTALAVPCVLMLFWRRSLFFQRYESAG